MDFTGMRWIRIICHFLFVGFYPGWAIHSNMLLCRSIFFPSQQSPLSRKHFVCEGGPLQVVLTASFHGGHVATVSSLAWLFDEAFRLQRKQPPNFANMSCMYACTEICRWFSSAVRYAEDVTTISSLAGPFDSALTA